MNPKSESRLLGFLHRKKRPSHPSLLASIPPLGPSPSKSTPELTERLKTLPLFTKEILALCPRFRVLVVGKAGVGKSSLISHTFGIDMKSISHQKAGKSDINSELISPQNSRFVLHDSMGFEHGDMDNLETAKNFLKARGGEDVPLQEQVHIMWLCIQVPYAGGRVFEKGDEEFLELASAIKVPVVVVFTQFDMLVDSMFQDLDLPDDAPEDTIEKLCVEKAEEKFQELCVKPLQKINPELRYATSSGVMVYPCTEAVWGGNTKPDRQALDRLIQVSLVLVEEDVEGEAWIVYAMAQRGNAQMKLDGYWRGLASSTNFPGTKLEKCLDTVHEEMTDSWNFYDPNDLLLGDEFRKKIKILAQLVTPDDEKAKSLFGNIDVAGPVGGATAAAAAVIGLTTWFVDFIANLYHKTPEALRCFMGYIIDLTLILNELYFVVLHNPLPRRVTNADIDKALENYNNSDLGRVHRDIRRYVRQASFLKIVQSNVAEMKVKELILEYSSGPTLRESTS
ncbi:hypothetical protein B0H19DRAFT_1186083 [Mycena capillaripes]|nr:hypothetical protein B0H19DRAFT_1186083 [Mycena capillaripes]